jgi:hypothetical protein
LRQPALSLRLAVVVFDKFPDLQLILGHWGELVLFYLERIDMMSGPARLPRNISDYFKSHISVTPSGILSLSRRYFRWESEVLGVDRVLFATDYPLGIERPSDTRSFLESLKLSENDQAATGNGSAPEYGAERDAFLVADYLSLTVICTEYSNVDVTPLPKKPPSTGMVSAWSAATLNATWPSVTGIPWVGS